MTKDSRREPREDIRALNITQGIYQYTHSPSERNDLTPKRSLPIYHQNTASNKKNLILPKQNQIKF